MHQHTQMVSLPSDSGSIYCIPAKPQSTCYSIIKTFSWMLNKTYMTFHHSCLFLIPSLQILTSACVLKSFLNYVSMCLLLSKVNNPSRQVMPICEFYSCQKPIALKASQLGNKDVITICKGLACLCKEICCSRENCQNFRQQKLLNISAFTLVNITSGNIWNIHHGSPLLLFYGCSCCRHQRN